MAAFRINLWRFAPLVAVLLVAFSGAAAASPDPVSPTPQAENTALWAAADDFDLRFSHFQNTDEEGRSLEDITAIEQDRFGFIWIGTLNGLVRFDGYQYKLYKNSFADKNSLSHNHVSDILEDRQGRLWVSTFGGGVNLYDPDSDGFKRFVNEPGNPESLGGNIVFCVFEDQEGMLWFGGPPETGLNRYDPASGAFRHYSPQDTPDDKGLYPASGVWEIVQDASGLLWMAADFVLTSFDQKADRFAHYMPSSSEKRLNTLLQDSRGKIWVGGTSGLHVFNPESGQFTSYLPDIEVNVDSLLLNPAERLLVGTEGQGLYLFDPQQGRFLRQFRHEPNDPRSLSGHDTPVLFMDVAGLIWVGTSRGLDCINAWQTQFPFFGNDPLKPHTLSDDHIAALAGAHDGTIWAGIDFVLNKLDPASGRVTRYPLDPAQIDIGGPGISALHSDSHGVIWFGLSSDKNLYRFDPNSNNIKALSPFSDQSSSGPPPQIRDFLEDGDQGFYFAVEHYGLFHYNPRTDAFTNYLSPRFDHFSDSPNTVADDRLQALARDTSGNVWTGSFAGTISRFDPRNKKFTHFLPASDTPGGLPGNWIEDLHVAPDGIVWAATHGGLLRLDPATGTHKLFTTEDGLPNLLLFSIEADESGRLWIGTQYGLARYDPKTATFASYSHGDGLPVTAFNPRVRWKNREGKMFFGGDQGLTAFTPNDVRASPFQPPVVLTEMMLFNQPVPAGPDSPLNRPIWQTKDLTLQHGQNVLTFSFAALSYLEPHRNRYRYILQGFDRGWNRVGSDRHFATYTGLEPGSYVLRVQGTNNDAVWSAHEATLKLTILPPWWKTWWFRILAVFLGAALLYSLYLVRVSALKKRKAELEHKVEERTHQLQQAQGELRKAKDAAESANEAKSSFLANMSHELRTPLNAIIGFSQIMRRDKNLTAEERKTLGVILRSGEHLLTLINQVLDLSKIEAGRITLNKKDFNLHQLLYEIREMFVHKAEDKGLRLTVEYPDDLPRFIRTDELKLRQILINLLNNALKFTQQGRITVLARTTPSPATGTDTTAIPLEFVVQDTGPGIAPEDLEALFEAFTQTETGRAAQEGTGLGLTISRKFVELMGGQLCVESELGQGTRFLFDLLAKPAANKTELPERDRNLDRVVGLASGQPDFRLLVADDQDENRNFLVKLLQPLGFQVKVAVDGQEAVEFWDDWRPHLILMDMRMPVLDGRAATKRIKASPGGEKTIVVAVSASSFEEDRAKALASGCDDFLAKPFRFEELLQILQQRLHVQYAYDEQPAEQDEAAPVSLADIPPQDLTTLPEKHLMALRNAVERVDFDMAMRCVEQIAPEHPKLAAALKRSVENYRFDSLQNMIDKMTS